MIVLFLVDVGATSGQGFGQGFTVLDAAKYAVEYFVKVCCGPGEAGVPCLPAW